MNARIGVWDPELFSAYRAAPDGYRKKALANQLYIENEPLVKTLVAQMLGKGEPKGRHIPAELRRLNRAENVESWEDGMGAATIGFAKALRDFDPSIIGRNGKPVKIPFFLGMKIKYELQCLIERSTNVRTPRDTPSELVPRGFERFEVEEDLERAMFDNGLEVEEEPVALVTMRAPEPPPRRRRRCASSRRDPRPRSRTS